MKKQITYVYDVSNMQECTKYKLPFPIKSDSNVTIAYIVLINVHVFNWCMAKLQFFQETRHKQNLLQVDHTISKNVSIFMVLLIQVSNSHIKTLNFVQVAIDAIQQYHASTFQ